MLKYAFALVTAPLVLTIGILVTAQQSPQNQQNQQRQQAMLQANWL